MGLGFMGAFGVCRVFAGFAAGFGVCSCSWSLQRVCSACLGFANGFGVYGCILGSAGCLWGLQLSLGFAECLQGVLRACTEFAAEFGVCSRIWGLQSAGFANGSGGCILGSAGCLQPELKVWGLQLHFGVLHRVCSTCTGFAAGLGVGGQFGLCRVFAT